MVTKDWTEVGQEPSLNDIMSDPIVALVMQRDNLVAEDVWQVVEKAKETLEQKAA